MPLYAAYGSNLWHEQMARRCPGAHVAGSAMLPGWRLVLRRFALIERDEASAVPVGLWHVTPRHLLALDLHEGPHCYRRVLMDLPEPVAGERQAAIYLEIARREPPPAPGYVERLRRGYEDFGFDPAPLEAALAALG